MNLADGRAGTVLARLLLSGLLLWAPVAGRAQTPAAHAEAARTEPARVAPRLPADSVTHHTIELPGETLHITATAGAIHVPGEHELPDADIVFTAYAREDADPASRPVTFLFNGGPGASSAWLQFGAAGPWRLLMPVSGPPTPSMPVTLVPNAETWLDFTDLVFLDPPGTGFSPAPDSEQARRNVWSVDGDIRLLARAIRLWLEHAGRVASPKAIAGESYGGFRAPRLARALQTGESVGISAVVMISPVLDFAMRGNELDPLMWAARLTAMTAAAREAHGPVSRETLADVEAYATGEYIGDLLRGPRDEVALDRIAERVSGFIGLDRALVRRLSGRIDIGTFLRERRPGQVGSAYDPALADPDAFPRAIGRRGPDPVLDGLRAPLTQAVLDLMPNRLNWRPDTRYEVLNDRIARQWNWGESVTPPDSVDALRTALELDPRLRVTIVHGLADLVTPYLTTQLILDQLPPPADPDRVRIVTLPGGHMPYLRDVSRAALHDASRATLLDSVRAHSREATPAAMNRTSASP
jgi:carboxypeptidase C (cathepsin A)